MLREITVKDYIQHTEIAARGLFGAISEELQRYKPIKTELESIASKHRIDFEVLEEFDDVDPFRSQHTFAAYAEAQMQSKLIQYSVDVLATGVLQLAKQGIALIVHADNRHTQGRSVGSQALSGVIWHSRNQSMHWEEGVPTNDKTRKCFETLTKEFGVQFDLHKDSGNKAKDVIELIGWSNYGEYAKDMESILAV